jgi:thioredoxin 1
MGVLKFSAGWCQPCKMLSKTLESIDYEDISNIDIDERPDLAQKYKVRGVPTLIKVDKEGVEVSRVVGAQTQAKLEEWLSE